MFTRIEIYPDSSGGLVFDFHHRQMDFDRHWRHLLKVKNATMEQAAVYLPQAVEAAKDVVREELAAADAGG